jgi:hypothetical protein
MRAETIGRRQDGSRIDGVNSGDRIVARATLLAFLRFRNGFDSLAILNYQFGWLRGLQKRLERRPEREPSYGSTDADSVSARLRE